MQDIIANFFAWSGPNVIAASAAATTVWFLLTIGKPRHVLHLLVTMGAAGIAVLIISLLAAFLGFAPVAQAGLLGVASGVIAGFLLRSRE